ncbi:hypothetical protein SAMN05421749_103287 [Acinetobacter marinus]|uniref:Uncharacterized protein n=1 Tax=Acinetobacter marinus TaxID=281375 RepID=A0A1G6J9X9_9GAMM|nr:hypothetical protein [Acinetobacter marinus]SDC15511.1 hypothetical protein SAMN05421749_103287 [Acinetobacter marinus]
MKFKEYLQSLSEDQIQAYAQRVGTTPNYLMVHLFYAYKEPRKKLREALSRESDGMVTDDDVLEHFGFTSKRDSAHA